jgi:RecG-like helicase
LRLPVEVHVQVGVDARAEHGRRAHTVALRPARDRFAWGAGPVTAARLAERGLESVRDLLAFLPLGYDDFRTLYPLSALARLPSGQAVVVQARVRRVRPFFRRLLDVYLEQDGVQVRARWFRPNAGMVKTYAKGSLVGLAGSLRRAKDGAVELIHPRNVTALLAGLGTSGLGLQPRYPAVQKVPGRVIEKLVAAAVEQAAGLLPDVLPEGVAQRLGFPRWLIRFARFINPRLRFPTRGWQSFRPGAHRRSGAWPLRTSSSCRSDWPWREAAPAAPRAGL